MRISHSPEPGTSLIVHTKSKSIGLYFVDTMKPAACSSSAGECWDRFDTDYNPTSPCRPPEAPSPPLFRPLTASMSSPAIARHSSTSPPHARQCLLRLRHQFQSGAEPLPASASGSPTALPPRGEPILRGSAMEFSSTSICSPKPRGSTPRRQRRARNRSH